MKNRSRRGAERALLTLTTVLLLIGAAGAAWIAVRGAMAYQHLDAARDVLVGVGSSDSDPTVWADDLAAARDDMAAARALTSDPVWAAAGSLPWAGPQLTAIAALAGAADGAVAALEPVSAAASALSSGSLRTSDGGYDVELLASWEPAADRATVALTDATSRLSAVELRDVLPALADQVTRADELFARARADADALHRTTRLLPAMLGADGPRSYLVLFQNSAEWRSLGGVVGAVAQLDTDQGRITLTAQASSTDFRDAGGEPVADVPEGLRPLFDERPARYVQNVTQLPDFAAGAPLAREMWRQQHGTEVDGVIAVDPVALSYLLTTTGPVSLPSGDVLTSENTVPLLLDEVYRRYSDPKQQDAFFQSATSAVFGALAAGDLEPRALVEALDRSGRERRLLVWSADSQEQAVLDGSTLQGGLPGSGDGATTLGVYVNDATMISWPSSTCGSGPRRRGARMAPQCSASRCAMTLPTRPPCRSTSPAGARMACPRATRSPASTSTYRRAPCFRTTPSPGTRTPRVSSVLRTAAMRCSSGRCGWRPANPRRSTSPSPRLGRRGWRR